MLTDQEVIDAYNRVAESHNRFAHEHEALIDLARAECLAAGLSLDAMDEIVTASVQSHTKIPMSVVYSQTPWIIRAVSHAVIVGVEIGKTVAATIASEVNPDADVPDYPPESP